MTKTLKLGQTVKSTTTSLTADATFRTIFTAGASGSKIFGVYSDGVNDTANLVIQIGVTRSSVNYILSSGKNDQYKRSVGANTFFQSDNYLNRMAGLPTDETGSPYLFLVSGDTLTAMKASGNNVNMVVFADNF